MDRNTWKYDLPVDWALSDAEIDSIVLVKEIVVKNKQQTYYICDECNKAFLSRIRLKRHKVTHKDRDKHRLLPSNEGKEERRAGEQLEEQPYFCEFCAKTFSQRLEFLKHLCEHTGEVFLEPPLDDFKNIQAEEPQKNINSGGVSLKKKPNLLFCKICPKSFRYRIALSKHLKIHSTEKPKNILKEGKLLDDLKNYKKEDPQENIRREPLGLKKNRERFFCKSCPKSFHYRIALSKHLKTHLAEKPNTILKEKKPLGDFENCKEKGSQENLPLGLKNKRERLFCDSCPKSFLYQTALLKHLKSHSKKQSKIILKRKEQLTSISKGKELLDDFENFQEEAPQENISGQPPGLKKNKERLFCDSCPKSFLFRTALLRHLKVHSTKQLKSISKAKGLLENLEKCQDEEPPNNRNSESQGIKKNRERLFCDNCPKSFLYRRALVKHLTNHLTGQSRTILKRKHYCCDSCSESFNARYKFLKHLRVHNVKKFSNLPTEEFLQGEEPIKKKPFVPEDKNRKVYTCAFCAETYYKRLELIKHLPIHSRRQRKRKIHNDEAPFDYEPQPCEFCSKVFNHQSELLRHLCEHTGEKPFPCEFCEEFFIDKKSLKKHYHLHARVVKFSPTGENLKKRQYKYFCNMCDRSFFQVEHLKSHNRTHTGERPYSCYHCDKHFTQKSVLNRHYLIHSGAQPFICLECGRTFSLNANLLRHAQSHRGEKPYSCEICFKSFTQKVNLVNHSYIHTGMRPFCCLLCSKSFTKKIGFMRHMRDHAEMGT